MKRAVYQAICLALVIISGDFLPMNSRAADNPEGSPPSPSLQQQIDQLKSGQEKVLRELSEIKALLQEKTRRADYPARPTRPSVVTLGVHGESFRGESQAKVAVMEYSDFDCSYCAKFVREAYPKLEAQYINTGKIKYYFRDLPAPEHTNSLFKAQMARCAGEQGKFWAMHDLLFADTTPVTAELLDSRAQLLGLDSAQFKECVTTGRYADAIQRSAAGARRMGVDGTPAFLIGTVSRDGDTITATKFVIGGEDYGALTAAIDELLAAELKKD